MKIYGILYSIGSTAGALIGHKHTALGAYDVHALPKDASALEMVVDGAMALPGMAPVDVVKRGSAIPTLSSEVRNATQQTVFSTMASATPIPSITAVVLAATTSFPVTVSNCFNFADPDTGAAPGCECDNWDGVLPYLSGSSSCGYSVISSSIAPPQATTTNTFSTNAKFPYTKTLSNEAIVAYATTSQLQAGEPEWAGSGASTIIQAGSSIQVFVGTKLPGQTVGAITGNHLYTLISDRLATACPTPTGGSTVTKCKDVEPITSIAYVQNGDLAEGSLELGLPIVKYSQPHIREALIAAVAAVHKGTSEDPKNKKVLSYPDRGAPCAECSTIDQGFSTMNNSHVPQQIFAQLFKQTDATDGVLETSSLELEAVFEASDAEINCEAGALTLDSIALLGLIPGLEWIGAVVGPAAFAFSLTCALQAFDNGSTNTIS